jgi:hypothetical protein
MRRSGWQRACRVNMGRRSVPGELVNLCMGLAGGSVALRIRLMCRTVEPHGVRSDESQWKVVGLEKVVIRRHSLR